MTNQKAINKLIYSRQVADDEYQKDWCEALDMAIKALQQESCGDTIYRQVVLDAIENEYKGRANELLAHEIVNIMAIIDDVPPANPTKTGHWIDTGSGQECSECHEIQYGYDNYRFYCANCGCRMIPPQESEDKE